MTDKGRNKTSEGTKEIEKEWTFNRHKGVNSFADFISDNNILGVKTNTDPDFTQHLFSSLASVREKREPEKEAD